VTALSQGEQDIDPKALATRVPPLRF